jgi:predicted CXXCH cytochrome family protein
MLYDEKIMKRKKVTAAKNFMTLLVLALTVLLISSVAHSTTIVNSRHDMSFVTNRPDMKLGGTPLYINDYQEVCVYCHTPHGANTETGAPLWNRATPAGPYTMYDSSTMINDMPSGPSGLSLACLSCHDGTIAVDEIINIPNSGVINSLAHYKMQPGGGNCGICHGGGAVYDATASYISTNLSNDHPISIGYPTSPGRFNVPDNALTGWTDVKLYSGKVECSSCHAVHDPAIAPFLRKSNSGSLLCTKCHTK